MSTYRAVLFDLDGTLVDSLDDIAESMNAALAELGLAVHTRQDYCRFIGDGVRTLAERALPADRRSPPSIDGCVKRMQRIYDARLTHHTRPYPGIPELLAALEARDIPIAVLSNKRHDFTRRMVGELFPNVAFAAVLGQRPDVPKKPDATAVHEIADTVGIARTAWLYVGDTPTDMQTARNAAMTAIGVSWGFRSAEELRAHGAEQIIAHPSELLDVL